MEESKIKLMKDAFRKGRYKKALKNANNYLSNVNPSDWDALWMKATIYSTPLPKYTNYYAAIGIIMVALDRDRTDINRWLAAAEVFDLCGIYAEAERCYRKVLEMDPTNYGAIIGLAVSLGSLGTQITKEEAKSLLETAISSKPDKWNAYHHLASLLLMRLGDKEKAMEMYKSALVRLSNTDPANELMRPELEKQIKRLKEEMTEKKESI